MYIAGMVIGIRFVFAFYERRVRRVRKTVVGIGTDRILSFNNIISKPYRLHVQSKKYYNRNNSRLNQTFSNGLRHFNSRPYNIF